MEFKHKSVDNIGLHGAHGHDIDGHDVTDALEFSSLLDTHYAGYQWMVHVNSEGQVIDIKNLHVNAEYGWRIRFYNLMTRDELKHAVINAGGEILERAGLQRGKNTGQQVDFVEGITKLQYQPAVQRNIAKYAELLNGPRTTIEH